MEIDIEKIYPDSEQPRQIFVGIKELANTIKQKGMINPIIIDKNYRIICGERRFRAAKLAGLEKVPVVIKEIKDTERLELQLIEDVHNKLLSPLERAESWFKLKKNKGLTNVQLSQILGVTERYVYKILKLADLPKEMRFALENNQITIKDMLKVRSLPEDKQHFAFRQITRSYEKPKLKYMPRDFMRKKGVGFKVLPSAKGETLKHFVIKCILFKILKDLDRNVNCEVEVEGAIADIIDFTNRNVYEVETNLTQERLKKKLEDFKNFNDVFIINVKDVPDNIFDIEKYLKERVM